MPSLASCPFHLLAATPLDIIGLGRRFHISRVEQRGWQRGRVGEEGREGRAGVIPAAQRAHDSVVGAGSKKLASLAGKRPEL